MVLCAEAVSGVGKVDPAAVNGETGAFADVREYNLRRTKVLVIIARPKLPPIITLVLSFLQRNRERGKMVGQFRVFVAEPIPSRPLGNVRQPPFGFGHLLACPPAWNDNQESSVIFNAVSSYVLSAEERFDERLAVWG